MNVLGKILGSALVATCISMFIIFFSIYTLGFIVQIFNLNFEKDAYWIFSVSFYSGLIMWIISFAYSMHLMDK